MITEKEFEELFDRYILEKHLSIRKLTKPNGEVFYEGIRLKTELERMFKDSVSEVESDIELR